MVRKKIRMRHLSLSTEDTYCGWIARYYDYTKRLPAAMAPEKKAEAFLTELATKRGVAARTQNQALAAVLFLYSAVLEKPLGNVNPLRAKAPSHQRSAPSREQVRLFRSAVRDTPGTPARLLVDLIYGTGMRVSEPLELRIKDILWEDRQIVIRNAKGGKDRRVPIPRICFEPLRLQMERARILWELDRKNSPEVGVPPSLPAGQEIPVEPPQLALVLDVSRRRALQRPLYGPPDALPPARQLAAALREGCRRPGATWRTHHGTRLAPCFRHPHDGLGFRRANDRRTYGT